MALRTVGVRLQAEVSGYLNNMRTAKSSTQDFVGGLDKAAKSGHLDAVADQAGRMGLGLAGAFAVAVGAAAKFDKQMSEVSAVSGAAAGDMDRLRQSALQAGKDTTFSATEAAQAEAELAKAGLGTADILGGALKGSLSLAAAGTLDLAEAADISAKTMNVFQLKGGDVSHIADVLAASANKSATDVHEMGEALKMGGLAASAAGMGLEETVGTLSAFADRALVGSDAGTSLKTAIMMLQAPSIKAKATMDELGISAYDVQGNFIGTTKLAGVLQTALGGLTQEQRNAALATIFGADGMRAANILYGLGEQGIRDYVAAVDDQGAAAEVAAKKTDNLMGDVERLTGSLETLAIQSGSGANGGLRTLTQGVGAVVDQFGELPPAIGSTVTVLAGVGGAALLAGAGWVKMRRSTADALAELRNTGPVGTKAAGALQSTAKWAGRATAAFVALEVGSAAMSAAFGKDLNPQIDGLAASLEDFGATGARTGEAARLFGKDFEHLSYDLGTLDSAALARFGNGLAGVAESLDFGFGDAADESLAKAKERISAIDSALAQMVQGGNADAAAAAFDRIAKEADRQGVSVDELKAGLPQYSSAIQLAGDASKSAAGDVAAVGVAADQTAEDVDKLNEAFDGLFKIQMDLDEAALAYQQGIADLYEELTKGERTLNRQKQAGRDNVGAILDQIKVIQDLRDARYAHGETLDEVNKKYGTDIAGLRATLVQLGYNTTAVDDLLGEYAKVPDEVATPVSAPGATTAKKQVEDFNFAIRNVPPSKTVPFWATTTEATAAVDVLKKKIAELKDKHVYISGTVYWTSKGDLKVPGGTILKNRWGGAYEHAADGLLREASMYGPTTPGRYMIAEQETGGEAFIPKYGDRDRSLGILDKAAGWYGATVQPAQQYVSGGTTSVLVKVQVDGSVTVEGTGVLNGLRKAVRVGGGNVQTVLGREG